MKRWAIAVGGILLVVVGLATLILPAYTDVAMVCELTCSAKGHRSWLLGFDTGTWYEASPIELRLTAMGLPVEHRWKLLGDTSYTIFGQVHTIGCSSPHRAAIHAKWYWPYFESLSDEELRSIYTMFQTTDDQQLDSQLEALDERMNEYYRGLQ